MVCFGSYYAYDGILSDIIILWLPLWLDFLIFFAIIHTEISPLQTDMIKTDACDGQTFCSSSQFGQLYSFYSWPNTVNRNEGLVPLVDELAFCCLHALVLRFHLLIRWLDEGLCSDSKSSESI